MKLETYIKIGMYSMYTMQGLAAACMVAIPITMFVLGYNESQKPLLEKQRQAVESVYEKNTELRSRLVNSRESRKKIYLNAIAKPHYSIIEKNVLIAEFRTSDSIAAHTIEAIDSIVAQHGKRNIDSITAEYGKWLYDKNGSRFCY